MTNYIFIHAINSWNNYISASNLKMLAPIGILITIKWSRVKLANCSLFRTKVLVCWNMYKIWIKELNISGTCAINYSVPKLWMKPYHWAVLGTRSMHNRHFAKIALISDGKLVPLSTDFVTHGKQCFMLFYVTNGTQSLNKWHFKTYFQ